MYFADLNKQEILSNSVDLGDYYEYTLGTSGNYHFKESA